MVKDAKDRLGEKTEEVFTYMKRDYRSIIGCGDLPQNGQILPKEQRIARKEVMKIIKGVEKTYESCGAERCHQRRRGGSRVP